MDKVCLMIETNVKNIEGDSYLYYFKSRVRYSETDIEGWLSLNGVINYLQDCSTFQSEDLGVGISHLNKIHRAWLLSSWQIIIDRYPKLGEEITVGTQAYGCTPMFGKRNFVIKDDNGKFCVRANSLWVLVNTETGRMVRIEAADFEMYGRHEPIQMEYADRKIKIPKKGEIAESFTVRHYHLDTNNHVNNGQYVVMAREFVPEDFKVYCMRAEYKKAAVLGDVIVPHIYDIEKGYIVTLCDEADNIYAAISLESK